MEETSPMCFSGNHGLCLTGCGCVCHRDETDADITLTQFADMVQETATYKDSVRNALLNLSQEDCIKLFSIFYATTGFVGEAGEVANKVKKILRDNGGIVDNAVKERVLGELGGVVWYLSALASEFDLRIEDVVNYNYKQIRGRQERGTLHGDGDNR